jgi:hypothetical protein
MALKFVVDTRLRPHRGSERSILPVGGASGFDRLISASAVPNVRRLPVSLRVLAGPRQVDELG